MSFNPSKCEFLIKKATKFQYYIQGAAIKEEQHAKYLDVTLNYKLSWTDHIHSITSKATSMIGLLRRNFHRCPTQTKSILYLTLVRPILKYAATVWEPYYQTGINQLEAIQRREARFVMNRYDHYQSFTNMLHKFN